MIPAQPWSSCSHPKERPGHVGVGAAGGRGKVRRSLDNNYNDDDDDDDDHNNKNNSNNNNNNMAGDILTIWSTLSTPTDKNASWSPARSSRPSPGEARSQRLKFPFLPAFDIWSLTWMIKSNCLMFPFLPIGITFDIWSLVEIWPSHLQASPTQSPTRLLPVKYNIYQI